MGKNTKLKKTKKETSEVSSQQVYKVLPLEDHPITHSPNSKTSVIKGRLKVKEEFFQKISYLCKKYPSREWSGVLFYKKNIDLKKHLIEVDVIDIHPMHIGTSASTGFHYDESLLDLYDKKPELEKCTNGLIHSHNTMGVFFSATDISELKDNAEHYNGYLSVVVNNKLEVAAKLVWVGSYIHESDYNIPGLQTSRVKKDVKGLFTLDLALQKEAIPLEDEVFIERVDELDKEDKKKKSVSHASYSLYGGVNAYGRGGYGYGYGYGYQRDLVGYDEDEEKDEDEKKDEKENNHNKQSPSTAITLSRVRTTLFSTIKREQAQKLLFLSLFEHSQREPLKQKTFEELLETIEANVTRAIQTKPSSLNRWVDYLSRKSTINTIYYTTQVFGGTYFNHDEYLYFLDTLKTRLINIMGKNYDDDRFKYGFKFSSRLVTEITRILNKRK